MSSDMDNYKHDKTCGECLDEDCPSRLDNKDDRADLRCFTEAPRPDASSGSTELVGCAAIGDFVTVRMSKGAYRLKLTTQEQVDIVNNELLTQSGWGLIKSAN